MNADAYLVRLGLDPDAFVEPTLSALEQVQRTHVQTVPFETLAVTGDPFDESDDGDGVRLERPHLFEKIVERERGGFCFELNGLFNWLLCELGFDADRIAARVVGDDGAGRPPANHHANVVELDQRYVVDVGMGVPTMRRPLPLDGSIRTDDVGVSWRVVECDRPDETYTTQYRDDSDADWQNRYYFSDTPRELTYFEATCDYLQSAPESPFTGDPVVSRATGDGYVKLRPDSLVRRVGSEETEEPVEAGAWHRVLEREFGVRYRPA
ncbi:arylamine N-acetyltransferase family protein [Haloferax profundi]|uniref:Arylamine N-acetyltransferase n=1 Tax=Haloferax profundi TaxID=1544718 RepID=A0A0W1SMZ8_9EURY|nr:arylamine N-acetyltransferase [Haloferax profundi]KTG27698.1 arylamine N-acetyltransferase [Haloferax profundi]